MKVHVCILMAGLCFLINTSVFAEAHGHGGGGYHGAPPSNNAYHGSGNYNHGGTYNNGYHGHGNYNNVWDGGIWYDDNLNDDTNVVVGVPDPGYYDPSCQTVDDCSTGTCVLVNTCDQE